MLKRQNCRRIKIFANIFFFHRYPDPLWSKPYYITLYHTNSKDDIFIIEYFVLHKQPTLSLHLAAILIKFTMKAALI